MSALKVALYASGAVLVAGILMWLSGAVIDISHLTSMRETIAYGELLKINTQLDPDVDHRGVYVVRTDRLDGVIEYELIDPHGHRVVSAVLEQYSIDKPFPIGEAGTYTLILKNSGRPASIEGGIGPAPDELRTRVGEIGFVAMMAGFVTSVLFSVILIKKTLF